MFRDGGAMVEEVKNEETAKVAMTGVQIYTDSCLTSYIAGIVTMS